MGHSLPLFLYIRIFNKVDNKNCSLKIHRWRDSNSGSLMLKATTLTTEPQPLPKSSVCIATKHSSFELFKLRAKRKFRRMFWRAYLLSKEVECFQVITANNYLKGFIMKCAFPSLHNVVATGAKKLESSVWSDKNSVYLRRSRFVHIKLTYILE